MQTMNDAIMTSEILAGEEDARREAAYIAAEYDAEVEAELAAERALVYGEEWQSNDADMDRWECAAMDAEIERMNAGLDRVLTVEEEYDDLPF